MAQRPLFVPDGSGQPWVRTLTLQFQWFAGFSKPQARRSIAALHNAAAHAGFGRVLEISSKSPDALGFRLSAFNLLITLPDGRMTSVESAFQGSKVFIDGGPYTDLYSVPARDAKRDPRIRTGTSLRTFRFAGVDWPLTPATLFYDWLYLRALLEHHTLAEGLLQYDAFTDIAFNPARSLNCQARSAALFSALQRSGLLTRDLPDRDAFLQLVEGPLPRVQTSPQVDLFS